MKLLLLASAYAGAFFFTKGNKMNMALISQEIAKREGGKKQVSIAQIKEILRCLGDMIAENDEVSQALKIYAARRARKKK
jgi:hypothetical protein